MHPINLNVSIKGALKRPSLTATHIITHVCGKLFTYIATTFTPASIPMHVEFTFQTSAGANEMLVLIHNNFS